MSERIGHILVGDITVFYDEKDRAYVPSPVVRTTLPRKNFTPLHDGGVASVSSKDNRDLHKYFVANRGEMGNRATLFSLKALADAETNPEMRGIFKTKSFFTELLNGYMLARQLNSVPDDSSAKEDESFSSESIELFSDESGIPPRKKSPELPSQPVLVRLDSLEKNMLERLKSVQEQLQNMQSQHQEALAVQDLIQNPEIQKKAIELAAQNVLDESGKTAILDSFDKRHATHMATMQKQAADQETIFRTAQESRKRVTDEEREKLAQIRREILDERARHEELQRKRRKLEDEMEELQRNADQRAAAQRAGYTFPRAGKAPVVSAYMESVFGRK